MNSDRIEIRMGVGMMRYNNKSIYRGDWRRDKWNGEGVLIKESGERYEGGFVEGRRHDLNGQH